MAFCVGAGRKRSLLSSLQCETKVMPFGGNGVATFNLTKFLPQELFFTANGTASKADGVRKSQSTPAPLPSFSIPLFP